MSNIEDKLDKIIEILTEINAPKCQCSFWTGASKCPIPEHQPCPAGP